MMEVECRIHEMRPCLSRWMNSLACPMIGPPEGRDWGTPEALTAFGEPVPSIPGSFTCSGMRNNHPKASKAETISTVAMPSMIEFFCTRLPPTPSIHEMASGHKEGASPPRTRSRGQGRPSQGRPARQVPPPRPRILPLGPAWSPPGCRSPPRPHHRKALRHSHGSTPPVPVPVGLVPGTSPVCLAGHPVPLPHRGPALVPCQASPRPRVPRSPSCRRASSAPA